MRIETNGKRTVGGHSILAISMANCFMSTGQMNERYMPEDSGYRRDPNSSGSPMMSQGTSTFMSPNI